MRGNTKALLEIIKRENIGLVHARSRAPAWPARAAARKVGIPFVTTYHGIYNGKTRLKIRYNAIMAKGDFVIANSEFTKAHILKTHGIDPAKIITILRGVDMARFDPAIIKPGAKTALRQNWGISKTRPLLLLPGRVTRLKGHIVAIEALAALRDEGISADFVFLGDHAGREDYVAEIKTKTSALDLDGNVHICGHCDDMPTALAASDVVISASLQPESFGRIAAEAQAMQKLVVATNHGGSRETIIDGQSGFLVAPGNAQALAAGIASVLALRPAQRKAMGEAARKRIAEQFSDTRLKTATLNVYQNAIAAHKAL